MLEMEFPPLISYLAPRRQMIFSVLFIINAMRLLKQFETEVKVWRNGYDHQGIAQMLGKCIESHNYMVGLEKEMKEYLEDNDTTWNGLKPDLELCDKSLDSLLLKLKTYQRQYEIIGGLIEVTKMEFKVTIMDSLLPELVQNITNIMIKRDAFRDAKTTQLQKLTKSYGRFNPIMDEDLLPALIGLTRKGLNLNINSFNEEYSPELFNISVLQDLHSLFEELDLLYEIEMEIPPTEISSNDWLPFSSLLLGLVESTNIVNPEYENSFKNMKYYEIPKFYTSNKRTLHQFVPWADYKTAIIYKAGQACEELRARRDNEFVNLLEKVGAKTVEINALIREVNEYRIFIEIEVPQFFLSDF